MKCRIFGHLKKTTLLLLAALLSFLPLLSGVLSHNVSALDITSTTEVASIEGFSFENSVGLSYTRTGVKPFVFSSTTTGNLNVQSRLLAPQISLSSSGIKDRFWTLYMDIYIFSQADGQPVITCLNTAAGAKYVIDSCDVISGGSYNYSEVSSGGWSYNNSGSGVISQNGLYFNSSSVITHYILALAGHVSNSDNNKTMNFRGDFLQVTTGLYEISISLSNVRFFTSESAESQAINNQTEQQQEYHDEAVDASNDAGDVSNSQGQQAESSGTTLLAAFTSFVGAVTSASPTSCVISGDLGIGGFSTGNLDLCAFSPPPVLQVVSSLIMIGALVPISIFTARKMINLFRSFTNG